MPLNSLLNSCKFTAGSSGTSAFTDGTAFAGFRNLSNAGAVTGTKYSYRAESADRTQWEEGTGTAVNSGGWTLQRTTILEGTNGTSAVNFSNAPIVFITPLVHDLLPRREVLAAARTYYVRTDGSDSNNGLANSSGGAFLTLQKAIDTVAMLDMSVYDVTIQKGAGTYSTSVGNVLKQCVGSGQVIIIGDETTPSNVVITTSGTMAITDGNILAAGISTIYHVRGVKFTSTASGARVALNVASNTTVKMQKCDFGTGFTYHMATFDGGIIDTTGDWTVSGGAAFSMGAYRTGVITSGNRTITITVSGTPAFSTSFVQASLLGIVQGLGWTFSGSATGVRYSSTVNAGINSAGGGASFFPGNSAGATASGGQYT